MRDYSKISPKFWIGPTGKKLRAKGTEAVLVSIYLLSCPLSNMLGLFYIPLTYIAHETGLGMEGASMGLRWALDAGFCHYDEATEMVWVVEMASYQISEQLEVSDKRCKGIQKDYDEMPDNPFLSAFYDKYKSAFHLTKKRESSMKLASPLDGASMPLRSQEQEQEQKQKQEQEQKNLASGKKPAAAPIDNSELQNACKETWRSYGDAYFQRYGVAPTRNAKVSAVIKQFVKRIGLKESPHVAAFYVWHNEGFYVKKLHPVDLLLKDAEGLRTQWATNATMTSTRAQQIDKTQTNASVVDAALKLSEGVSNAQT